MNCVKYMINIYLKICEEEYEDEEDGDGKPEEIY